MGRIVSSMSSFVMVSWASAAGTTKVERNASFRFTAANREAIVVPASVSSAEDFCVSRTHQFH